MQGLFASLEDYDLQNTTVPEVDDGDVVEMFEAAQEVGREVEADTAQAQDAMAVVEALENYRELLKRELALGDGVNRTTTRAIEIGVEALTARYRDEDGAPLAWSMESFDTPGQAVRATQASLEGIGDIMSDITAKAKAFAQRAMAGLAKMTRATANFFSSVKGRAQKLRKQVESAEFESKTLKADDYAYICTGGKIDFGASLGNVQKFIDNFVLGDAIVQPSREVEGVIAGILDRVTEKTTNKEFAQMLKDMEAEITSKVKGGFKNGTMVITDRMSLQLSAGDGFFDIDAVDNKKPVGGEVQSIDKQSAIKALDTIIAQCTEMESVNWENAFNRVVNDKTASNESLENSLGWPAFRTAIATCFKWAYMLGVLGVVVGSIANLLLMLGGYVFAALPLILGATGVIAALNPVTMSVVFIVTAIRMRGKTIEEIKNKVEESQDQPEPSMESSVEEIDPAVKQEVEKKLQQVNTKIVNFILTAAEHTDLMLKSVYMDGMDYIQDSM